MNTRISRRPWVGSVSAATLLACACLWPLAGRAADNLGAAAKAIKAGDLRTAVIELRNAVRADPQNASARFELAQVELELADPVAAEHDVRAAAQRGFDVHKTLPLLGESLLAQHRAADLLKEFQVKGKDKTVDAEVLVLRGEAQERLGKLDDAGTSFQQAETLDPKNLGAPVADARLAMTRGDVKAASEQVDRVLSMQPRSVEANVLKATLLTRKGDVAGAKALLDQVIAEQPPALPARLERASILVGEGKPLEAKSDIDAVLKISPNNIQALFLRALLMHDQHDDKSAEVLLQRLEPIFPSFPRTYLLAAAVQQQLGEIQQAEESAARYIARVPVDPNGYKMLAQLYARAGRPDQAIAPLKQAIEAGKGDAAIYDMLGRAYAATGDAARSAVALGKANELAPDDVGLQVALAGVLVVNGTPQKALDELDRALTKEPANPAVQESAVAAALATGDMAKADSVLARIKAGAPDTPTLQNLTAMLQLAKLDAAGAQTTLEALLKAHPDFTPAKVNLARALIMQGQGKQAEATLSAILKDTPASEPALSLLVNAQVRSHRAADAVALLERAHAAAPANALLTQQLGTLYIQNGAPRKALDLADATPAPAATTTTTTTAGAGTPTPPVAARPGSAAPNSRLLLLKANAELALKQPDKARETLSRLLGLDPRALTVRRELAAIEVQAGDYEAARNVIKDGLRVTPGTYQLDLDYALIDLKASGLPAALTTARQLQQDEQANPDLRALEGDVLMSDKKPLDAAKAYTEAAAAAPSALLTQRLAQAYMAAGKPADARAALAAWVTKNPDDLAAIGTMSELDVSSGKLDAAESELKTVLAKQPRNAMALNNLAWLYGLKGDKQAKPMAEEAYLLAPSPQSADTLGWILTQDGDAARGLVLLRQAASSGDPRIAYHLGVALNDVGQKADAVKVLNAVVAVKGDFTEKADAQKLLSQITKGS